ncbi:MAG: hypothetical protein ACYCPT_05475 [Acidimicrobiales bacterium]
MPHHRLTQNPNLSAISRLKRQFFVKTGAALLEPIRQLGVRHLPGLTHVAWQKELSPPGSEVYETHKVQHVALVTFAQHEFTHHSLGLNYPRPAIYAHEEVAIGLSAA